MRGSVRALRFFSVPLGRHGHLSGPYRPSCKPTVDLALRRERQSYFDELADGAPFSSRFVVESHFVY